MSSAYDQQIKKLIDHIQTLNQALHERNMQIVQWQQVARAVQDERARIARSLLDMLKQALASDAVSTIKYEAEKPQELLDEDRVIGAKKLGIGADAVRVIPVEDVFRN